ncbi:MAG TPA: cysteine--tRNA ligase [Candidatus Limnocylindria bacterium]|nr:cysteine--tRNA ligase [Candidatus Limnocylindria bacterium]
MLKLYNTLTKDIEELHKKGHLNLYTCGPTVYNYAHVGNLRSYILADVLYRTLKYQGYKPKWVMNITDIDDKTIKGTVEKFGKEASVEDLKKFTEEYYQIFLNDLHEVNVLVKEITFIKVTEVIPQIQDFIIKLMEKGYAYKADDGVYFSIEKYQKDFGDYSELVGLHFMEGKKTGARVKVDEYEKENLSDFALWKAHTPEDANIFWDHAALGKGRPGWHIECSAINQVAFKGQPTDIHTGGVDLIFPHHTNEIAQSQALLGKGNFVKHWFHSEHLLVDGKKMAKSAKNFYTLKDLQGKIPLSSLSLRYLFTQTSYRSLQNFTMESLTASYKALEKLYNTLRAHKIIGEKQELQKNIFDGYLKDAAKNLIHDLSIPVFVGQVWDVLSNKSANIHTQDAVLEDFDAILGLSLKNPPSVFNDIELPAGVKKLVSEREKAREQRNFSESDVLREKIEDLGYEVMDGVEGQIVKKN